jgi:hypothetical protein
VTPFTFRYTLTRRQRLAELFPWLPALAGSVGFSVGVAYLAGVASLWFLILLALPVILYRGLIFLLVELIFFPGKLVEVTVDTEELTLRVGDDTRQLALDGIIQVFRAEGDADWTVLHIDGTTLAIPTGLIAPEQLDYLKGFALRAARERWAANPRE